MHRHVQLPRDIAAPSVVAGYPVGIAGRYRAKQVDAE